MQYFLFLLLLLLFLVIVDLLLAFLRLGLKNLRRVYGAFFFYKGYRETTYAVERNLAIKVLIVGDSTAFGPGADLEETIASRLALKYDVSITNLSQNGARTREIIPQLDKAKDQKFDLTFVFAGNNDIWRFTNFKKLKVDISSLLDIAKTKSDTVILFRGGNIGNCPFFPFLFSKIYTYRSRKVREMFLFIVNLLL